MRIITLTEEQFDEYSKNHKYNNYCQTSNYARFKQFEGFKKHFLGFEDNSKNIFGAAMVIYKELFWGYKYAYAPRGLLIDYENEQMLEAVTNSLKKLLKKQKFIFLKIDPPIIASERDQNGKILYFSNTINTILKNLKKNNYEHLGFNLYSETELPRWNVFARLNPNIKELFNSYTKENRERLIEANRHGLILIEDKEKDIEALYDLIKKNYSKKWKTYFSNLLNCYSNTDKIKIFYTYVSSTTYAKNATKYYEVENEKNNQLQKMIENQATGKYDIEKVINDRMESDKKLAIYKKDIEIANNLNLMYPEGLITGVVLTIEETNGVNIILNYEDEKYKNFNSIYFANYELMKYFVKLNYKYINLGAATGNFDPKSNFYQLLIDKIGFNSSVIEYIGEFNLVINPLMYKRYKRLQEKEKRNRKKK